jgi:hypothetical protein
VSGELHLLFGAGQVGSRLARLLLESGRRVRIAKRSSAGVPSGAEVACGDATDPGFCAEAARGARVVYHCMNPPYSTRVWAEVVPRLMDNLIAAAGRAGARLVVLDNLYLLGRPGGRPLDEDTPIRPCSAKGEIRARAAERLFEAHRRGDVEATTGRASDYYGPGGTLTHLGDQFWRPALAGKTAWVLLDPDAIHTYHYIPDGGGRRVRPALDAALPARGEHANARDPARASAGAGAQVHHRASLDGGPRRRVRPAGPRGGRDALSMGRAVRGRRSPVPRAIRRATRRRGRGGGGDGGVGRGALREAVPAFGRLTGAARIVDARRGGFRRS